MSGILAAYTVGGMADTVLNISNTVKPNIQTMLTAAGWNGFTRVKIVVDPGALVNTLTVPSLSYPSGVLLVVGAGALIGGTSGGGHAVTTAVPISIENHGAIKGGGGHGGSGGFARCWRQGVMVSGFGGSSGRGQGFASDSLAILTRSNGSPGDSQTYTGPSFGPGDKGYATATGGRGGDGADWRGSGWKGAYGSLAGTYDDGVTEEGANGGPGGKNINGIEHVTWLVRGDA